MESLSYGYWLLVAITVGYAVVAFDLGFRFANYPMALVFGAYSVANVGLIWGMK